MKKIIISNHITNNSGLYIGKKVLRTVTVDSSFVGIGKSGIINRSEFHKLVKDLEPGADDFTVMPA